MGRTIRPLIVIAVLFVIWKFGVPFIKAKTGQTGVDAPAASAGGSCVQSAQRASEAWGNGLSQFVNPPYDLDMWKAFRDNVDSSINAAEAECDCSAESCNKAKAALRDLHALVGDVESTIRNGSAPTEFVQRQERIDNQLNDAAALAADGK